MVAEVTSCGPACLAERRSVHRDLQKWSKNLLHMVGLECVVKQFLDCSVWPSISPFIREETKDGLPEETANDWDPSHSCHICARKTLPTAEMEGRKSGRPSRDIVGSQKSRNNGATIGEMAVVSSDSGKKSANNSMKNSLSAYDPSVQLALQLQHMYGPALGLHNPYQNLGGYDSAAYMSQMMAIYSQQQQSANLSALVSADPYLWAMFSPFAGSSGLPMELGCPPPPSFSPMERQTVNGYGQPEPKRHQQQSNANSIPTPSTPECRPIEQLRSPSTVEKKKSPVKQERSVSAAVSEPISNGMATPTEEQPLDLSVKKSPKSPNSPNCTAQSKPKSVVNTTSFRPVNLPVSKSLQSLSMRDKQIDNGKFMLPSNCNSNGQKRAYSQIDLEAAVQDIRSGRLGTRRASVVYGIPRSTLRNKVYKLEAALDQVSFSSATGTGSESESGTVGKRTKSLTYVQRDFRPRRIDGTKSAESDVDLKNKSFGDELGRQLDSNSVVSSSTNSSLRAQKCANTANRAYQPTQPLSLCETSLSGPVQMTMENLFKDVLVSRIQNLNNLSLADLKKSEGFCHQSATTPLMERIRNESVRRAQIYSIANILGESGPTGDSPTVDPMGKLHDCFNSEMSGRDDSESEDLMKGDDYSEELKQLEIDCVPGGKRLKSTGNRVSDRRDRKSASTVGYDSSFPGDLDSEAFSGGSGSESDRKVRPKRGQYRKYDKTALAEAVRAVRRGEMSVHRAGSYYGVPHSTLEYKVKERNLLRPKKKDQNKSKSTVMLSDIEEFSGPADNCSSADVAEMLSTGGFSETDDSKLVSTSDFHTNSNSPASDNSPTNGQSQNGTGADEEGMSDDCRKMSMCSIEKSSAWNSPGSSDQTDKIGGGKDYRKWVTFSLNNQSSNKDVTAVCNTEVCQMST